MALQLWLGNTTLTALIDRIVDGACVVAPDLARSRAREIVDLMFRTRVQQTVSCTRHGVCSDMGGAVWGGHGRLPITLGTARPCQLSDDEATDLPNTLAAAIADASTTLLLGDPQRDAVTDRMATTFRQALAPYLFENKQCGHAPICHALQSDPFEPAA